MRHLIGHRNAKTYVLANLFDFLFCLFDQFRIDLRDGLGLVNEIHKFRDINKIILVLISNLDQKSFFLVVQSLRNLIKTIDEIVTRNNGLIE